MNDQVSKCVTKFISGFQMRNKIHKRHEDDKDENENPPFSWATKKKAHIHRLEYLNSKGITTITGYLHCKKCDNEYQATYNLDTEYARVVEFIKANEAKMHDRAPKEWMNPILPTCTKCGEAAAKPSFPKKKKFINWLFLFLGQLLGCCTLNQLKYFCKQTKNHRTGAKDRVLYLAYLDIVKQLDGKN